MLNLLPPFSLKDKRISRPAVGPIESSPEIPSDMEVQLVDWMWLVEIDKPSYSYLGRFELPDRSVLLLSSKSS